MTLKKLQELGSNFSMTGLRRMDAPGNLRSGQAVKSSHSSLQNDLDFEAQRNKKRKTSVVLFLSRNGKILSVTRGNNLEDKNMPGGGVEEGETLEDAAIRELWEETGLWADELQPVYTRDTPDALITAFHVTEYHGRLRSSSEGIASWELPESLLSSSYGDFLADVLKAVKR